MDKNTGDNGRYSRQSALEGFEEAAALLRKASVAVIGAGGVASAALPLLAGGGAGRIKICDFDAVSLSNLHRQTLYTETQIGRNKANEAAARLAAINSSIEITASSDKLSSIQEISAFVAGADLCIDATDSFLSRRDISRACALAGVRLIACCAAGFTAQIFELDASFTFDDVAPGACEPPQKLPIFAPAAHLSGVWGAGKALRIIAKAEDFVAGYMQSYDFQTNKYFSGRL